MKAVRAEIASAGFFLCGDVSVEVEWLIQEQVRYESDRAPDVDNILKPLIDALAGPEGLLIDDNQVQHVSCSWIDVASENEEINVIVRFRAGEWLPKRGLVFVQFERALCLPLPDQEWGIIGLAWLESFKGMLAARTSAESLGLSYSFLRMLMPQQRVFHRTRLQGFEVIDEETFRQRHGAEAQIHTLSATPVRTDSTLPPV